ncbi:MAG: endonuclease/exonuclease/phosphatase family protein [Acidimicrobiia bacterium]|nr:endonuclease/exonuclease/phosphatase family protein [Acidimicrobiia bacterium]
MRVMAWNTNWNVSKSIVERQTAAVVDLAPDVAFFSEWSPSPTRTTSSGVVRTSWSHLRGPTLAEKGFVHQCHQHALDYADDERDWRNPFWGVLGVSREPIVKVNTEPPLFAPGIWLEVTHPSTGLTLVGARLTAWQEKGRNKGLRRAAWSWMAEQFDRLAEVPAVVLGDFNTELRYRSEGLQRARGGDIFRSITRDRGWVDAFDAAEAAKTDTHVRNNGVGSRLDYAFVSPPAAGLVASAAAPEEAGEHRLLRRPATKKRPKQPGLSDHTPVMVDLVTDNLTAASP